MQREHRSSRRGLDRHSTVGDVYAHPLGRDVIGRILLQMGRSRLWVDNPVIRPLPLGLIERVGGRLMGPGFMDTLLELLNDVSDSPARTTGPVVPHWWKEAVFYQVYPRSFADSNGDGVGDLRGVINHLDHLTELGVDCLWLSPIFASPNEDNGYDISDYRAVMTEMGTQEDIDELIAACHERGMRIILDLVVNHTSDQHAWFRAARKDPDGPYGSYYMLRRGEPELLPNNWGSYFYGPAWRWLDDAKRWALHLFAPGQVDLNWDNPAVRREVADIVQWWLARGIDGFRLDVINFISKRPGLPDGNELVGRLMQYPGVEHYFHGPNLHRYLAELRREGFTRPGDTTEGPGCDPVAVMIGETPGIGVETGRLLTGEDRQELDLLFGFDLLDNPGKTRWDDYRYDLNELKAQMVSRESRLGSGDWVSLFWENHDNPRMISKVDADPRHRTALGKALAAIQLLSRGTSFIYQGQEIAAVNQAFPDAASFRDIETLNRLALQQDPESIDGVMAGSRDHARTPMRWDDSASHGFTTGTPWIGFHEQSTGYTVAEQRQDPNSVLNFYRRLIELRRQHRALRLGDVHYVDAHRRDYFAWRRELDGDSWLIEVNLSGRHLHRPHRDELVRTVLATGSGDPARLDPYEVRLHHLLG
ncbi:alpha-glucosidase [Tessaracoccus antarcticus]|uniref:Alpha-glucosidase n=1 Tax=Tessaracoccus antarcticus TaxID=2479848 RepID=A0A3M0GAJ9_9ACTN|nr:alpha-glucosidase [Tessaracoccus antarcticus]RMB61327.1 alpha-glucosidase [Tessaracoccus antarcticus]